MYIDVFEKCATFWTTLYLAGFEYSITAHGSNDFEGAADDSLWSSNQRIYTARRVEISLQITWHFKGRCSPLDQRLSNKKKIFGTDFQCHNIERGSFQGE